MSSAVRLVGLVVLMWALLGALGAAVLGPGAHCPAPAASRFGISHQEARDRSATPGNEPIARLDDPR